MGERMSLLRLEGLFVATVMVAVPAPDLAFAQATALVNSSALISVSPRAARALDEFKVNPGGLMARNPDGGGALAAEIRDILLADKAQLAAILSIVPQGTAAQQEALGSGLGLARLLYIRDPEFTSEIQKRVVELDNRNVLTGFSIFGGGGVAALTGSVPPAAPAPVLGPVGPVASAPAANSSGSGSGSDVGGGGSGVGVGGVSPRAAAGALQVTQN
jgi:hypothetical protein